MKHQLRNASFGFALTACLCIGMLAHGQTANPTPTIGVHADRSADVRFFNKTDVTNSFKKGDTLVLGTNYKVMTSKRDQAGEVELHAKYTDVFYIVEGNATIVVGGQLVGQKSTDPDELRGTSIQGGEIRQLSAGDVIVIPAGIPHWISRVEPPFHYFVVKVQIPAQ
jgi:mannose-6-phosphate isomerase-like protein (cupin superfamily)